MVTFRLVESISGLPCSLKHSIRPLPLDTWLRANIIWGHNPGRKDQTHWWTGWHSFPSFGQALRYAQRFKQPPLIVRCEVEKMWRKGTNKEVILSEWMRISTHDWKYALRPHKS